MTSPHAANPAGASPLRSARLVAAVAGVGAVGVMYRSFIMLVALAMAGCGGEKQEVMVGEHALQLQLQGRGLPTVVFESGAGMGLESWTKVQPKVARFASTIAYDRAGLGKSGAGPEPRDARRIAGELHTALHKVGAQPPYVLVGHSAGAFYIRLFADAYPEEVAGLVFVDPATEQVHDWFATHVPEALKAKVASSKMPPGVRAESQAHQLTAQQIRSIPLPVHLPAVVLSSTRPEHNHLPGFLAVLVNSHKELVGKLKAKHVLTETSGHNIQREQPELVVQAIQEITEQVRHKRP